MAACATLAQAQRPAFEVAVIKRNTSGDSFSSSRNTPGRVTVVNETLRNIIRSAYGPRDLQVLGGPSWIDGDKWDISAAVGPDNQSTSTKP
ncbi:MAG TPA: TIGR03435 family protein, partial [Vicinamibacterales bacterium]|nr:TIGR03435 family protein [Vicinamibacterales bacterium]